MHIHTYEDVIKACRFCFMCRHLDPVGNVTFQEADTPRGRALLLDRVRMDPTNLGNPDYIATVYRSALSGANRQNCVSHYDEVGLVLAARRDIVEAGLAPAAVKALANRLSEATFTVSGKGKSLYFGSQPELYPGCKVLSGGDPGYALLTLGFAEASQRVFERFQSAVAASGCQTLIVAEPSAQHFLGTRLESVTVVPCAEALLTSKLKRGPSRQAYYLESDFLRNYGGNSAAPRQVLAHCGYQLLPFGTNDEESYTAGEGAVVFGELQPELAAKLCLRIISQAGDLSSNLFITPSSSVQATLSQSNPQIRILSLEQAVAEQQQQPS